MIHRVFCPSRFELRPGAPGVRAVLFALSLGFWATSCTPVATPSAAPAPEPPAIPSIERGDLPDMLAEEASAALENARRSLEAGEFAQARESALNVIRRYPGARGSGEALSILARAALGLGELSQAMEASLGYLNLFDPSHPAYSEALLLRARTLAQGGEGPAAFQTLARLPPDLGREERTEGLEIARTLAEGAPMEELRAALAQMGDTHPLRGVFVVELAVSLYLGGEEAEARALAEQALARGLQPREEERARGILEGSLHELLGQPVILGAILPRSGVSPRLMEYGERILEGVQVAIQEFQGELRRPIRLEVLDPPEGPGGGALSIRQLEDMGAIGTVGPLTLGLLSDVASAKNPSVPVISPLASLPPEEAPGVLSLSGPDPGGASVVARYAWDLGLERVVILRPTTQEAQVYADAFQDAYRELGGTVPREVVFDSGATFFQPELEQVGSLLPDGLFLPLQPGDIQLLAPQFTFYGLDTLGIQLLGTDGWTDPEIVEGVDSRHTDGVVAATTRRTQGETETFRRFREAYEDLFQQTLRTELPAYGYDAAALILRALQEQPRGREGLMEALNRIENFPGATGRLSVSGGRIVREPHLVRILNHELIYISPRFE